MTFTDLTQLLLRAAAWAGEARGTAGADYPTILCADNPNNQTVGWTGWCKVAGVGEMHELWEISIQDFLGSCGQVRYFGRPPEAPEPRSAMHSTEARSRLAADLTHGVPEWLDRHVDSCGRCAAVMVHGQ
jgi:hypothetical protein